MKKENIKFTLYEQNFLFCKNGQNILSDLYPSQDKISEVLSFLPLQKIEVKNWDEIGLEFKQVLTSDELNQILSELKPSNSSEIRSYFSKNEKFNLNWIK